MAPKSCLNSSACVCSFNATYSDIMVSTDVNGNILQLLCYSGLHYEAAFLSVNFGDPLMRQECTLLCFALQCTV